MSDTIELMETDLSENDLFDSSKLLTAIHDNNLNTIKLYLEKNLFTDYVDDEENSLIHIAVLKKNRKSLCTLLEHDINPNQLNAEHLTPLHIAVLQKDLKSAKLLLKFGADKNIVDHNGKTPITIAEEVKFNEFLDIADKINTTSKIQTNNVNNEGFISNLSKNLEQTKNGSMNVNNMLDNILTSCEQYLSIPKKKLSLQIQSIQKNVELLTSKLFANLENIGEIPETEKLRILRKFLSIVNSTLINELSKQSCTEEIQKLSKLEHFLEDKIILSASGNFLKEEVQQYDQFIPETVPTYPETSEPETKKTLKEVLEEKLRTASKDSPYNYLDYKDDKIICRQVNREMCFIDKITIKTHHPINNNEVDGILDSTEEDISKDDIKEAKNAIKGAQNILLLSKSKKFDEIIRPGKKYNIHLVYFCSQNDSYENNLDALSRLSLGTGCTVHSFNYPGINNSTGHIDEKKDMIYAGLATINKLLQEHIALDRILLVSDSESYSIIKNITKQFLLRDLKINRVGVIDLTLEHNRKKFKPTSARKLLLYYNPNNAELALNTPHSKEEKIMEKFNEHLFYTKHPKLFEGSKNSPSLAKQIKNFIVSNQTFLRKHHEYQNPDQIRENIDIIKGEVQT